MCPFMDRVQRLVARGGRVVQPELVMTLPRCAADVLADHVLFEIEAIDRMYLNLYQPRCPTKNAAIPAPCCNRG